MNLRLAHLAGERVSEGGRFSETKWVVQTTKKSDVKERKKMGWGKVILGLFCCVSSGALFFLRTPASSSWLAATGGSGVTSDHCYFEAKDEPPLSSLRLLMRKPEF